MKNSLKQILDQIKEKQEQLDVEIDYESPTYRMHMGNKVRAREDITALRGLYREELLPRVLAVVATGDERLSDFVKIAKEEYGMSEIDSMVLVRSAIDTEAVDVFLDKDFSPSTFRVMSTALAEEIRESGISVMDSLEYRSDLNGIFLRNREDLEANLLASLEATFGTKLIATHLMEKVVSQAIEEEFDGPIYPVVITTPDQGLAGRLHDMLSGSVLLSVGVHLPIKSDKKIVLDNLDAEQVKEAMNTLKDTKKGKKAKKQKEI